MNLSGIGGGTDSFSGTITAAVVIGTANGTVSIATTTASGCGAWTTSGLKLLTSFSSEDNRVTKSSTPRFALFALASATNGRTAIAINRPMMNRTRSSICLSGLTEYLGLAADDNWFAPRMLIDKNGGFHRRFRS